MQIETVRSEALKALLPPPNVPLAKWIERTVRIPASASALPGKMHLWEFQKGWCEALEDPEIERITIAKGARIGFTQWLSAALGAFRRQRAGADHRLTANFRRRPRLFC